LNGRAIQPGGSLADTPYVACKVRHSGESLRTQLKSLLKRLDADAALDIGGRSIDRRSVHAPITMGVMAGGYKPLYKAWITDLSPDGIGALSEHEVPIGSVLYVNLGSVAGGDLLMPIKVCYSNRLLPHTYRIGGAFSFTEDDPSRTRLSA